MDKNTSRCSGLKIIGINSTESNIKINHLSELGDNWSIPSKCPACNRDILFTKENINKLLNCKCGQKIKLEIPDNLL